MPSERLTYKGMMLEGVPNLAVAIGYTNASWTLKCDLTCDYVCRLLNYMRQRGLSECMPRNDDPTVAVEGEPLLNLTSGYIRRSGHLLPRQGTRHPWRVHHSYLRDYRALKMSGVEDRVHGVPRSAPTGRIPEVDLAALVVRDVDVAHRCRVTRAQGAPT